MSSENEPPCPPFCMHVIGPDPFNQPLLLCIKVDAFALWKLERSRRMVDVVHERRVAHTRTVRMFRDAELALPSFADVAQLMCDGTVEWLMNSAGVGAMGGGCVRLLTHGQDVGQELEAEIIQTWYDHYVSGNGSRPSHVMREEKLRADDVADPTANVVADDSDQDLN